MAAASNPLHIIADIDTEHVPRVSAQRLDQRPVVGAKDIDVLIESAGDKERS